MTLKVVEIRPTNGASDDYWHDTTSAGHWAEADDLGESG